MSKYAIPCPYCKKPHIETVKRVSSVRGYVFSTEYGYVYHGGCVSCTRKKIITDLVKNMCLGWWSPPGLIITPICILQNLLSLIFIKWEDKIRGDMALKTDLADLRIGKDGLTNKQRHLIKVSCFCLVSAMLSDGELSDDEINVGINILSKAYGIPKNKARILLQEQIKTKLKISNEEINNLPLKMRITLFKMVIDIIYADKKLVQNEVFFCVKLGTTI